MRTHSLALVAAVRKAIGADELLMLTALALIARGLWLTWQPGAYLVPGLVILWIAMPARSYFIARPPVMESEKPSRRKP